MADVFLAKCRSELEEANCPWVVQTSDQELETWLFKAGPQHYKVLLWALTKIDPELNEHFHSIEESNLDEEIVKLFVNTGLCKSTESEIILGRVPRKGQESFWCNVLHQIQILQNFEEDYDSPTNCQYESALPFFSNLATNSDFWDLLEKEPNLLQPDILLPPLKMSFEELQHQLLKAEEDLMNICNKADESDLQTDSLHESHEHRRKSMSSHTGSCGSTPTLETQFTDRRELFDIQRNKIDKNFKEFLHNLEAVIPKTSPNPIAGHLSQIVMDLERKVCDFAQFLENQNEIKRVSASILNRAMVERPNKDKNSLHDFISTMLQQLTGIQAVLKTNNGTSLKFV